MNKRKIYILIGLALIGVLVLTACSSLPVLSKSTTSKSSNTSTQTQGQFNLANQPVENKLAIGILDLQGTPQAITAKQATTMLPLWQAVKSLSTSNNTSAAEMQALYTQIEGVLTPDQLKAIQNLNLTQAQTQALFQKYGIQFGQGGSSSLTPAQRATRVAQFQQTGDGAGGAGGGGFARGASSANGSGANGSAPTVRRTPAPGGSRGGFSGGLNVVLADPVIKVLQQTAGVSGS